MSADVRLHGFRTDLHNHQSRLISAFAASHIQNQNGDLGRVFARIEVLSTEAEEAERALELRRLGRRLRSVHTELAGYNRTLAQVDPALSHYVDVRLLRLWRSLPCHTRASSVWHPSKASCLVPVSICC